MIYQNLIILTITSLIVACPGLQHNNVHNWSRLKSSQTVQVSSMKNLSYKPSWCTCSSELIDVENETDCHCEGRNLTEIPQNLDNVTRLSIANAKIKALREYGVGKYSKNLKDLFLINLKEFCYVEPYVFRDFVKLRTIYISHSPKLQYLPAEVFYHTSKSFKTLRIIYSGLIEIPDLKFLSKTDILLQLDFEGNLITEIPENSFQIKTEQLILDNNVISTIQRRAFNGSEIGKLSLKGNKNLCTLNELAFDGIMTIRELDLSSSSIESLSTKGLEKLEILRIQNTPSLKEIPSVYNFKNLEKAYLTHPFHCCAFKFPSRHDPRRYNEHLQLIKLSKHDCESKMKMNESSSVLNYSIRNVRAIKLNESGRMTEALGLMDLYDTTEIGIDNDIDRLGTFMNGPVDPHDNFEAMCGKFNFATNKVVSCFPKPDALNPCEDVFDTIWLRVSVWIVIALSVVGNVAVLIVLLSNQSEFTVPKLLVCNLAFADLCMGIYLFLIALIDLHSKDEYFNYAFDWQYGMGCKTAGFLTVFAAHLSIFALTIITIERWFAINKAVFLNRRLKRRTAIYIMICGWIYSIIMAMLPLFGMSNYSSTSICLPMEVKDYPDTIYIITVLGLNGLGFIIVVICYVQIYLNLGNQDFTKPHASNRDMVVAKKMALLVFTNFACLAPITFFVIFALAGHSLITVTQSKFLIVFFYPLNSCANPYLYAILTSQWRRDALMLISKFGAFRKHANRYKNVYRHPSNSIPLNTINGSQCSNLRKANGEKVIMLCN
ncbi:lutropin-choriogonadotropic hormone receptor-like isoform X2 [Chironomus tepperi]|uniref:lutropin-choriogonadotropic hormone receptor-like isoform X2 n=1 Tax=Chironomus tepperi TaxID=113505 RepID=UPI00391F3102